MGHLTLQPTLPPSKTDIYFGMDHLVQFCHAISKRGVLLADGAIAKTHGALIQKALGYELISVPSRKTREAKQTLEDELLKRKLGRDTVIVGMGGGATTDLVAFIASTYMRGIPLVLIPTTLLGMVDASIGGKTGVDTPFGKNLIGTFYLPKAIFIEPELLKSLPEKEMKNGLSEILKYGLIEDASIWEKCARWKEEIFFLVHSSISCKVKIVGQDFEEKTGLRRILNFGHTVGHALELLSHYEMAHGEAVALGCMAESYLSHLLGYLSAHELEKILSLYRKLGYAFKKFDTKPFLEALSMDKKGKEGSFRFVLIDRIGHCVPFDGEYCRDVPRKELDQLIEWMKHG
jgi:3-dehydroquinate synthase